MTEFEALLEKLLDTFFHLPTLVVMLLLGLGTVVWLYDIGFDIGSGFLRLNSRLGTLNLYWINGCCQLDW